jgi:ornithine cyclodeaminase
MRVLTQADVRRLLPMSECIPLMEEALIGLARGEAVLPLRTIARVPGKPNFFAVMPAYTSSPAAIGVKALTVFPENHGTARDSHQGAVLLFEAEHGSLRAIMDATAITAIRTAAVSAVATRLLARHDARVLGIIGSGVQARMHVEAIPLVRPIDTVRVHSRNRRNCEALARYAEERGIRAIVDSSAEEVVRQSDVVCTVTSSLEPVLRGEWLRPGTHINAVGTATPTAREVDTEAVVRSRVYVDRRESALNEPGDILIPMREGAIGAEHLLAELGELLTGSPAGRIGDDNITLFKSLGLAVEDLAAARHVAERAELEGAGVSVDLCDSRL